MQQRKAAENVQMVVEAFKKIETNITEKFDNVSNVIEKRVLTIKDGRDGINGKDGRDGKDGRNGKDGLNGKPGLQGPPGKDGIDGADGVSVTNANIDFDGSLIINLSSGQQINAGEVVSPELEKKIIAVTRGGGSSGSVGDVTGPASASDNRIARFDGTTGKLIQSSPVTLGDGGNMSNIGTIGATGLATLSGGALVQGLTVGLGAGAVSTNTVVGLNAFQFNTTGNNTVANGYLALSANQTGNYNTAVGAYSIGSNISGQGNTAIGYSSLANVTGSNNTAVGPSAGQSVTTGSNNVIIGGYTGLAAPISETGSNYIVLSDGAANVRATFNSSGNFNVLGTTIISNVNVLNATYDSVSFSVTAEEINPSSLFFSADGSKMFVMGTTGDDVNEYVLSTPWVVSSATYSTVFSVAAQETFSRGLFFRADGLKMYVVGETNDTVFQYALTTPWNLATASYESLSFSVAAQDATPSGIFFNPNGLSMYVVGNTSDNVNQYTLSTAWNVSTATYLQTFSVAGQEGNPQDISFTGDGTRMFVLGSTGDDINVYNLTTPWDISTASSVGAFSIAAQESVPTGLYIKPDGKKMYVVGTNMDTVFQYTVPSVEIQLTGTTSINGSATVAQDLTVNGKFNTSGNVLVTSATGLGYGTGAGGTVTQLTSRTTGVTLSKPTGAITMFSAAGSATAATFTVTNTLVAATDTIILNQKSGTNLYVLLVTAVAAGSFNITFYTTGGVATDAPVINFAIIKGVTA
jgi:6-phosphogluconolactonase (cycloisomerase 2 family)